MGEEILRRMRMLMCFPALNRTPKPLNDFSANLTHSESLRAGGGELFYRFRASLTLQTPLTDKIQRLPFSVQGNMLR